MTTPDPSALPADTVAFANRMFDVARAGDPDGSLLAAIEAGLPPNLTNHQGNTLLMLCAYSSPPEKSVALSRALLDSGGDPNRLNDAGQSIIAGVVFKRIASQGRDELVRLLLERGADPRLGKPNAIETTLMFVKEQDEDGGLGKDRLLELFGATEDDKKRMESEGVRVPIPGH
ncbi:ankyrin [Lentinula aff. detonsa]|uniref:Ankyrin n=1 Tax=Lentinula aff. detonsa TaxID=2804958 RepID=A0AA38NJ49_9AGAR|nr:ankyrin [Lentinula aff. detonsa]KAJ3792816.1 ankyrin [Lentinula aff. detonsa]